MAFLYDRKLVIKESVGAKLILIRLKGSKNLMLALVLNQRQRNMLRLSKSC